MTEIERLAAELATAKLFEEALAHLKRTIYEGYVAALQGPPSQVALDRLRNLSETAAQSLARDLTGAQLNAMGDQIARMMEGGKRPLEAFRDLKDVTMLDSNRAKQFAQLEKYVEQAGLDPAEKARVLDREYERLLKDRRKTIAQTEGRKATSEARRAEADERKYKYKAWITRGAGNVCPECAANEAAGIIEIDEAFPSGVMQTPGHPGNCGCTVKYLPEKSKVAEMLHNAQIEKTQAALEDQRANDEAEKQAKQAARERARAEKKAKA